MIKKCIVCKRDFKSCSGSVHGGMRIKTRRNRTCLTCSKKCSIIYTRIRTRIVSDKINKQKREEKCSKKGCVQNVKDI